MGVGGLVVGVVVGALAGGVLVGAEVGEELDPPAGGVVVVVGVEVVVVEGWADVPGAVVAVNCWGKLFSIRWIRPDAPSRPLPDESSGAAGNHDDGTREPLDTGLRTRPGIRRVQAAAATHGDDLMRCARPRQRSITVQAE